MKKKVFKLVSWEIALLVLCAVSYGATTTSISQHGITWNFSSAVEYGQFVNGDYWVIGPLTVSSVSPTPGGGRNGSMVNPSVGGSQPYDDRAYGYNASVGVSFPYSITAGDSLISTDSWPEGVTEQTDYIGKTITHGSLTSAAVLTCLSSAPASDAFRPPYGGTTKPLFEKSDINYSLLPELDLPNQDPGYNFDDVGYFDEGGSQTVCEQYGRYFERPWILHKTDWSGRNIHPTQNMPNYHREVYTVVGEASVLLLAYHSDVNELLIPFLQLGIDSYYLILTGQGGSVSDADSSIHKWPVLLAGTLFNHSGMKSNSYNYRTEWMTYYIADGTSPYSSSVVPSGYTYNGYTVGWRQDPGCTEHEHLWPASEWGEEYVCVSGGGSTRETYRRINSPRYPAPALAAHIMDAVSDWNHQAFFDYTDRWMTEDEWFPERSIHVGSTTSGFCTDMWSAYRDYTPSGNQRPFAHAGPDQILTDTDENGSESVDLDGSASHDPDGTIVTYVWKEGATQIATGVNPNVTLDVGQHYILLTVTDNNDVNDTDEVVITVNSPGAATSEASWQNYNIDNQTGSFTFEFDATPHNENMDGLIGLCSGTADAYADLATTFRFYTYNEMDARDGSSYTADTTISYAPETSYHVRMVVNISSHTYSVYVTPSGQSEQTLASNYAFRTGTEGVSNLDHWAFRHESGSFTVDDVNVSGGSVDTTAPSPDPMTWSTEPYALTSGSISMTATTATDSAGVQYYFDCTTVGGHDSNWQAGATYEDTGLDANTSYTYRVKARDNSANQNETAYSTTKSATTYVEEDSTAPSPNPMTWSTDPYSTGSSSISMTATTATDTSGAEYYFECTAGGGNSSGWQDSSTYEDVGLSASTQYTYRVSARDKSSNQNQTSWSTTKSATTDAGGGDPNLTAWWKFDETSGTSASDSSGNSHTGTLENGASFTSGYVNNAVNFDGDNDRVSCGTWNVTGSAITICCWFKADSFTGSYYDGRLVAKTTSTASADHTWMLSGIKEGTSNKRLRFRLKTGGSTSTLIASSGNMATDTWYHGAAVYNGSTMKLYLDGDEVGSTSKSGSITTSSAGISIGQNPSGAGDVPWDGLIDDVRIYEYALSESELDDIISPPAGDTTPPSPDPMTWATDPNETGATSISMTATTATDASGVEYYFDCTAGGGHDSGWQDSTTYEDTGLDPNTQYTYRVKASDKSSNYNETAYSTTKSATTEATTAVTSTSAWQNFDIANQTGTFTFEFDATANGNNMDVCIGTTSGEADGWSDLATTVRFYTDGYFDAKDGPDYTSDASIPYSSGNTYHIRMEIDIPTHSYGVYITPPGQSEITLADDYDFRSTQSTVTNQDHWAFEHEIASVTVDDVEVTTYGSDTTPPSPNPMTWTIEPYGASPNSVSMTATTATDPCGVEYYFECTAGGGNDSGWQDSRFYEDTGLSELVQYSYRVKARDKSSNQNEGVYSTIVTAITQDGTPPGPNPMIWATDPYATGTSSISMTATTATDNGGAGNVEYYFECTAGDGNDSGWQDGTTYENTGLDPNTQYTYRVSARDKSSNLNQTGYSTAKSATTDAVDTTPPTPDPMTWATEPYATGTSSISMTATTATDASGVEYYFDCTAGGGNDSGWQDSTTYGDTGLDDLTEYTYRVKARDKSSNQNETAYSTTKSATTQDGTAPSPDPMTWATEPYATGETSISMTATTATDVSGVQYYFDCTAGGGNDSGWQASATYEDTGLDPDTQYTYQVKARDTSSSNNETSYSTTKSATTDAAAGDAEIIGSWVSGTSHSEESGSNRALLFFAFVETNPARTVTAVTYGGQSMTKIIEAETGAATKSYLVAYVLDEDGIDDATSSTFSPTWSGSPSNTPAYCSVFLSGVDQSDLIGASDSETGSTYAMETDALATNDGDMAIVAGTVGCNDQYWTINGFTEAIELAPGSADAIAGYKACTGSNVTPGVEHDQVNRQAIIGFIVQAN